MTKLRVLHMIGGLNSGGSQSVVLNLYKNIDREKIQFDFIIDEPNQIFYKPMIEQMGGKIYVLPKFKGFNYFRLRKAWKNFFKEHSEYKILHSHVRSYASIYISIAKKFGLKTIIHSHSTSNGKGVKSIIKNILQRSLRRKADYLMACSTESGEWLYGKKACKKSNYILLPNAIKITDFLYNPKIRDKYRKELGVENKFVIGHVGRFSEPKNHTFLLDVFSEVVKAREDAVLLLVGDGPLRLSIERKIIDLGVENSVILTGNRDDINNLYQVMDVFAFPSLWEGLPLAIVEAQANGLTCIVSDRVTKDIDLSELVQRFSLEDKVKWVENLSTLKNERKDVYGKIVSGGFNIKDTTQQITEFYLNLY